jgi:hypothetical protein
MAVIALQPFHITSSHNNYNWKHKSAMTHTSFFFSAIANNNEAVHHFETQDYNSAARCLANSLRVVKQALAEASDANCSQTVLTEPVLVTSCSMATHSLQAAISNCMPFSSYQHHTHKEDISSVLPEESIYVYGYASRISTKGLVHCNETCKTVSAIIVFHLALLYHLQALTFQDVSDTSGTYLRKALRLYEYSYLLHMSQSSSIDHQWAMGLLNNLAHVNHMLNDQLKANHYWQMLLSLIVCVREFHYSDDQGCVTMREEEPPMVGFLTNVTHLMLKSAVSAPAA